MAACQSLVFVASNWNAIGRVIQLFQREDAG